MEWLDWHIDTRVESQDRPVLRCLHNGEVVGKVDLTPGEMASVKRKFEQKTHANHSQTLGAIQEHLQALASDGLSDAELSL